MPAPGPASQKGRSRRSPSSPSSARQRSVDGMSTGIAASTAASARRDPAPSRAEPDPRRRHRTFPSSIRQSNRSACSSSLSDSAANISARHNCTTPRHPQRRQHDALRVLDAHRPPAPASAHRPSQTKRCRPTTCQTHLPAGLPNPPAARASFGKPADVAKTSR